MPLPHPDDRITSTRNPRVRAALELRDRRARDAAGRTLVDGSRELARAIAGGADVIETFVDHTRLDALGIDTVDRARAAGASVVPCSPAVLDRLAYGDRAEGLVGVVAVPDLGLEGLSLPDAPLVVVLEGVEKPGNLGAVLRSADAAGADAVIVSDPRTDLYNPNAVRASLGTIFTVPVASGPGSQVRAWLAARGIRPLAARVDARQVYTDADLRGPVALVLGSEAEGLTAAWAGDDITPVRVPMLGIADSLNVSVTTAVLLYEARRQRGLP